MDGILLQRKGSSALLLCIQCCFFSFSFLILFILRLIHFYQSSDFSLNILLTCLTHFRFGLCFFVVFFCTKKILLENTTFNNVICFFLSFVRVEWGMQTNYLKSCWGKIIEFEIVRFISIEKNCFFCAFESKTKKKKKSKILKILKTLFRQPDKKKGGNNTFDLY